MSDRIKYTIIVLGLITITVLIAPLVVILSGQYAYTAAVISCTTLAASGHYLHLLQKAFNK